MYMNKTNIAGGLTARSNKKATNSSSIEN